VPTLDTNCVLRWLVRDDPAATAKMDARVSAGQPFRVPDVVVIETIFVLESHYRFTRDEVAQAIRLVLGQAVFDIDRSLWAEVMDAYLRHAKLSVTDIYVVIDAQRRGHAPVLSFDKKLISQLRAIAP